MKRFVEHTLRGFGQLFLCNHPVSGLLFLLGIAVASPSNALLSLLGGGLVTLLASQLARNHELVKTGLFGVNGVLLGCLWSYFPEVSVPARCMGTIMGSVLIALTMVPVTVWMKRRKSPFVVFSVPYVLVAWLALGALTCTKQTDPRLSAAWKGLADKDYEKARTLFEATNGTESRVQSFREDGLGWTSFLAGPGATGGGNANLERAMQYFRAAIAHDDSLADAWDGLGWCSFRMGDFADAQKGFESALARDQRMADSWDGLGWIAFQKQDIAKAHANFLRAVECAPLLADAWTGLAQCLVLEGNDHGAARCRTAAARLQIYVATRLQFTSLWQLECWVLFFVGILYHSRWSAVSALAGVLVCVAGSRWIPACATVFQDIHFVYNLIGIFIALGGLYLRLNLGTVAWTAVVTILLTLAWQGLADGMAVAGYPLLCLPFNLALLGSTALFLLLQKAGWARAVVPLEWAATSSPERVRLLMVKHDTAQLCWDKLSVANQKGCGQVASSVLPNRSATS